MRIPAALGLKRTGIRLNRLNGSGPHAIAGSVNRDRLRRRAGLEQRAAHVGEDRA